MPTNTRSLALDMLLRINEEGAFCHLVLREIFAKPNNYQNRDKAFIKRLTAGTIERQIHLDYLINLYAKIPVEKMKPFIRNLLRMSVYQIIFMDNVPDRAACDEAVKLAAGRGFSALKGFVNGILRNISRQKYDMRLPEEAIEPVRSLSVHYSMPEWLIEKWLREYDFATTKDILRGLLQIKPVTIRLKSESAPNPAFNPHPYLDYAYEMFDGGNITELPGFDEGLFFVQDLSSMLVCEAAGISRDDLVIDVCAAPGGKALHAAERAKKVIARDVSEKKCELIRENAVRMKQTNIEIAVHDALIIDENLIGKADILLADLPCSGLGVIGRKPDIKYRVTPESLAEVCDLQRRILATVWQYVRPGGILLYSTCTINRDENEAMMSWFVANFPFEYDAFPEEFPDINRVGGLPFRQINPTNGMLQLLPGVHQSDGFFICRLRRQV
jgi:16S rRNA (cytosine967-C5)-methyltransferase